MAPPRPASSWLQEPGHALLELQLAADEAHVREALAQLAPSDPLCCLGLLYVRDDETPSVSYLYAWSAAARDAAFADDPEEGLADLWNPPHWDLDLDEVVEPPAPDETTSRLAAALHAAGCEDLPGAYLMDLAHRLGRVHLPVATTGDLAVWAAEHEGDDEPWLWMTAVARPEVAEAYRANGWLRGS